MKKKSEPLIKLAQENESTLKIVMATYGGLDVKEVIENNFILNNTIKFTICNRNFTDPMFGVFKRFEITIDDNGTIHEYKLNEGENFIYPYNENEVFAPVSGDNPPCGCGNK